MAVAALTLGSFFPGAPHDPLPATLAVEVMAQAALHLLPPRDDGPVLLAGVEEAILHRRLLAGDRLVAAARLAGRFGPAVRVSAVLEKDGKAVARATLLLSVGR